MELLLNLIPFLLMIIGGVAKGVADTVMVFFDTSVFRKLNPLWWDFNKSHPNKWKNGDKSKGDAFWKSSTWFVAVTDAWHLFILIEIVCFIIAIVIHESFLSDMISPIIKINVIVGKVIEGFLLLFTFLGSFELSYRIFKKDI